MPKSPFLIALLFFLITLPFGYWTISPLFVNKKVDEKIEQIAPSPINTQTPTAGTSATISHLREGEFEGAAIGHSGSGTVKIIRTDKNYLRLEDDFKVTNGPDLYIYFGNHDKYDSNAEVAKLKGNQGGQNYEIPSNIDQSKYSEVWIWCKAFSVPFAKAKLN